MAEHRDIEESEEILEYSETDPFEFWKDKQKELVTSVVDYNLSTIADLVTSESIDLSPRYQRRFRWSSDRQSRLIESFLMNVPVPPIFLNEDEYGEYSIIDGKQRITAIVEFFRGRLRLEKLEVFQDLNGKTIDDMPTKLRRVLETRPNLRTIIILRQSDPDIKFEVFRRLNTGGVRLNAQEIRNSAFPGPFNDIIFELSEHKLFHQLLGIGIRNKSRSTMWQEMRDVEFVLRYFTFRSTWKSFSGGMKRHMDDFMANNRQPPEKWLKEAKKDFLGTLEVVSQVFGESAFQRWEPEKQKWRRQVLASLFDAEMFACRGFSPEDFQGKAHKITNEFKTQFSDPDFRKSIDAATNTPSLFKQRIAAVQTLLSKFST